MKVCFVGAGSIGKRHIRNLVRLSKEIGFPLEIHLLRSSFRLLEDDIRNIVSKEWYAITDINEVYDAIFITNPTYMHYKTLIDLKGKTEFFFIEKPIFDNCDVDLTPFVSDDKTVYYVACPLRYTKVLKKAKEIIETKKVISVRSICSSYLPDWRPGVDYRNTYSAHKNQGGGVKIDIIHEWDYITYLFGFPQKVFQFCGTYSELEIDSEDLAVYIAQYEDKLIELHLDYFGKQIRRNCEIITNTDIYSFDIANSCISKNGELFEQLEELPNDKYMEELRFFYSLMQGNASNINDINHAIKIMQIACENSF